MATEKKRILLIGRIPPPVGGVTVFVQRLHESLKANNYVTLIRSRWQAFSPSIFFKIIFGCFDEVILNNFSIYALTFLYLSRLLHKTRLIDHNHSRHFKNKGIKKILFSFFLPQLKKIQVVGEQLFSNYAIFDPLPLEYLDPQSFLCKDLEPSSRNFLPPAYSEFIAKPFDALILVSAWRINHRRETELYGLQSAIQLVPELLEKGRKIGLIVAIGDSRLSAGEIHRLQEQALKLKVENQIFFLLDQPQLLSVYKDIDLYLRPTSTDGNSVSIHEALHLGTTTIASDVAPRPKGVKVYPYSDTNRLIELILEVIG